MTASSLLADPSPSQSPENVASPSRKDTQQDWGVYQPLRSWGATACTLWEQDGTNKWFVCQSWGEAKFCDSSSVWPLLSRAAESNSYKTAVTQDATIPICLLAYPLTSSSRVLLVVVDLQTQPSVKDRLSNMADMIPLLDRTDPVLADENATWRAIGKNVLDKLRTDVRSCGKKWHRYAVICGLIAAVLAIPVPYSICCRVTCEPAVRRYVSAPFDGRIEHVYALPGQTVTHGDLLCKFNGDELRNEWAALTSERNQCEQRLMASLSTGDHSKAAASQLEMEYAERKRQVLQDRMAKLSVTSPIGGVVVRGDLERATGASVEVGHELFEIASLDLMIAELAVPEAEILRIKEGMSATIYWDAEQLGRNDTALKTIHLRSEIRDQQCVFIADAELANADRKLRPGMTGEARVWAGYRAVGWIAFHRPVEAIRETLGW
ncbi:MAG: efflux RND transporter periplasmic adaptor subunit [Planctomycetales bacterium]|nr:efflux RND transporter periplasmic adaptor subunit [Planctomycetales bacterium]